MIKRRLGSALRARSYWTQCREIILRVITHNVMIVARIRVFYRAGHRRKRGQERMALSEELTLCQQGFAKF
jgi:hypothetical protein